MAIALRTSASATNSVNNTALTPAWPGAVPVDGDMLIAFAADINQSAISTPAGWSVLATQLAGSSLRMVAYWRRALAEPLSNTWTVTTASRSWAWVGAYSGVSTSLIPVIATGTDTGLTLDCPAVSVLPDGWLINAHAGRHSTDGTVDTFHISDGSAAERFEWGTNASPNDATASVYDSDRPLPAGTYTRTITAELSSQAVCSLMSIALAPEVIDGGGIVSADGIRWGIHV